MIPLNTVKEPLNDKRVRQAISMGSTARAMPQVLSQGLRPVYDDPYGPASGIECKDNGALGYDPEKAKKLLADYGKPVQAGAHRDGDAARPRGRAGLPGRHEEDRHRRSRSSRSTRPSSSRRR